MKYLEPKFKFNISKQAARLETLVIIIMLRKCQFTRVKTIMVYFWFVVLSPSQEFLVMKNWI